MVCPLGWTPANGTAGTIDLRGEFIRGWDNGRGADPARDLGTWQANELQAHNHGLDSRVIYTNGATWGPVDVVSGGGGDGYGITAPIGGSETRPRNVALLACVQQ